MISFGIKNHCSEQMVTSIKYHGVADHLVLADDLVSGTHCQKQGTSHSELPVTTTTSTLSSMKYDELTSVYNRYNFTEVLGHHLLNQNKGAALLLIDIHNFKLINDSVGFEVGDSVLMEISSIIRNFATEEDIIGRLGGDEFVIFFADKKMEDVKKIAENIHHAIKNHGFTHYGTTLTISVSLGIVDLSYNKENITVTMALQAADFAAMASKKNGSIYQVYSPENDDIIFFQEAPIWIGRIKSALENNGFEIFAQEIRSISNKGTPHAEVLIRMKDEHNGYYQPGQFLSVAERFNLIQKIDEWMIIETFKLHRNTGQTTVLSINMSAESIKNDAFIKKVIQYARRFHIKPSSIILEVTETMEFDDMNAALSNINKLKAFGFKIALDDFGSGFSTLTYLKNIEADILKIDGVFVEGITKNSRDRAIVENVVSIAHSLDMKCVAEFVQDDASIAILEASGVDYIQGYGVHKPELCVDWIARQRK